MDNTIYLCAPVNALSRGYSNRMCPWPSSSNMGISVWEPSMTSMASWCCWMARCTRSPPTGRSRSIEDEQTLTPFACVTRYRPISHDELDQELTYDAFLDWLVRLLPSPNLFYALRIEGEFAAIKARSVPKQENYRTLVEVAREQTLFQYENVSGTLVGFFTPTFMASLSVPGLHLHFLSADFRSGGHLLECRPRKVRAGVQFINRLELALPLSLDYLTWDFRRDIRQDLHQAER